MYRLNPLQRNVLISVDEVMFHAPTRHAMDPRTIQQSIIIAEERFILPVMGRAFYNAFAAAKNVLITSGNIVANQALITASGSNYTLVAGDRVNAMEYLSADNILLWKEILWKLTAECVMFCAMPENFVVFAAEGVIHPNPPASAMTTSGVVTPDLRAVKWAMDKKLQDRIDPLVESFKSYLCDNRGLYGLWDAAGCPSCNDNTGHTRKTAWINVYDDNEPCGCP